MAIVETRQSSFRIQMNNMLTPDVLHMSFVFCMYFCIRIRTDRIQNTQNGITKIVKP